MGPRNIWEDESDMLTTSGLIRFHSVFIYFGLLTKPAVSEGRPLLVEIECFVSGSLPWPPLSEVVLFA